MIRALMSCNWYAATQNCSSYWRLMLLVDKTRCDINNTLMNRYILEAHVCVILCFQPVSVPVKRHPGCKLRNMRILSTFEWLAISLSSLANATTSIHISPFLMPIYFLAQFRIFHSISFQFSVLSLLVLLFFHFPFPSMRLSLSSQH